MHVMYHRVPVLGPTTKFSVTNIKSTVHWQYGNANKPFPSTSTVTHHLQSTSTALYSFAILMSDYLGNIHHAGTPAGGSSAYPSEPQNYPRPYPMGFPTTANPDVVYEPRFVVRLLPDLDHLVCLSLLQAQGHTTYRNNATLGRSTNSEVLMQLARNRIIRNAQLSS